ncbi:hypothetical protein Leryth_013775 [Lithospermum erythrorhizon]|nr:hypothetical protein Leryth_013775 [Lithospermum erythrorhizon]
MLVYGATLFNNVAREAPLLPHNYYYHGISEAVNGYCNIPSHRWKASLRRDYCSSDCFHHCRYHFACAYFHPNCMFNYICNSLVMSFVLCDYIIM